MIKNLKVNIPWLLNKSSVKKKQFEQTLPNLSLNKAQQVIWYSLSNERKKYAGSILANEQADGNLHKLLDTSTSNFLGVLQQKDYKNILQDVQNSSKMLNITTNYFQAFKELNSEQRRALIYNINSNNTPEVESTFNQLKNSQEIIEINNKKKRKLINTEIKQKEIDNLKVSANSINKVANNIKGQIISLGCKKTKFEQEHELTFTRTQRAVWLSLSASRKKEIINMLQTETESESAILNQLLNNHTSRFLMVAQENNFKNIFQDMQHSPFMCGLITEIAEFKMFTDLTPEQKIDLNTISLTGNPLLKNTILVNFPAWAYYKNIGAIERFNVEDILAATQRGLRPGMRPGMRPNIRNPDNITNIHHAHSIVNNIIHLINKDLPILQKEEEKEIIQEFAQYTQTKQKELENELNNLIQTLTQLKQEIGTNLPSQQQVKKLLNLDATIKECKKSIIDCKNARNYLQQSAHFKNNNDKINGNTLSQLTAKLIKLQDIEIKNRKNKEDWVNINKSSAENKISYLNELIKRLSECSTVNDNNGQIVEYAGLGGSCWKGVYERLVLSVRPFLELKDYIPSVNEYKEAFNKSIVSVLKDMSEQGLNDNDIQKIKSCIIDESGTIDSSFNLKLFKIIESKVRNKQKEEFPALQTNTQEKELWHKLINDNELKENMQYIDLPDELFNALNIEKPAPEKIVIPTQQKLPQGLQGIDLNALRVKQEAARKKAEQEEALNI